MTNEEIKNRQDELMQMIDDLAEKKLEPVTLKTTNDNYEEYFINVCAG